MQRAIRANNNVLLEAFPIPTRNYVDALINKHTTLDTHSKNNLCSIICLRLIFDMHFLLKRLT